ncbi:MAG: lyase family protein [Lachnospiraceae bacterium]|nr:lyase family protein [Lachnospiraceae bacterium]
MIYGIETTQALHNFPVNGQKVPETLIQAMLTVKKCAAKSLNSTKEIKAETASAIIKACDHLLVNFDMELFPTNAFQGGAGTSTHMNVNEAIACYASQYAGYTIDPLDDVNKYQSTNDVYPTALRISSIQWIRRLSDEVSKLQEALQKKELEWDTIYKMGRTELMDAQIITLGQEFGAYAQAIARDRWRIYKVEERLRQINLGGTAVGTGSTASRKYSFRVIEYLREETGIGLSRAEYPIDLTQNNDVFVEVSGLLKSLSVNLMKISNDLRLMASAPYHEIILKPLQKGSTIMPGKINPVIPEMTTQVAMEVMAYDSAISFAAASGNLELNAFLPLIAYNLLTSLEMLCNTVSIFRTKCIEPLKACKDGCERHLDSIVIYGTALLPYIGYEKASELMAKSHYQKDRLKDLLITETDMKKEEIESVFSTSHSSTYRN